MKKPRPQLKFNLSLLNCAILVHILKRENLRAYWILSMKFVIIVTHIKAGDSNENGKRKIRYIEVSAMPFREFFTCVRKERNMKIHCVAAVLVVIAGVILKISAIEWCICMVLFGLVMALEHGEYGSGSGGGYGDRRISPVGEKLRKIPQQEQCSLRQLWQQSQGALYFLPKIAQILQ